MKMPLKCKLWFIWQRIINFNFSEFTAVVVAAMLTISVAYPHFESLNKKNKIISIEFKSKTGEVISGVVAIKDDKNYTLEILSLVGVILGPLILFWKFVVESKNVIEFYRKTFELLKREYETLLDNPEIQNNEQDSIRIITSYFTKISDNGIVTKKDLLYIKKEIILLNKRYS